MNQINMQMKQLILQGLENRLRKYVSVKDDIEKKFTEWFQALVTAGQAMEAQANAPPTPPVPAEGAKK